MESETTKASWKEKAITRKGLTITDHEWSAGGGGGGGSNFNGDVKKKKGCHNGGGGGGGSASSPRCCQAEKCTADLTEAKQYHRRHRVCELHAKAQAVLVAGIHQRFCQQCSRFHELSEFDEAKRSCRRRLAGHNERRRKTPAEFKSTGKELVCGQVSEERGKFKIAIQDNAIDYKHLQTR